MTESNLHFTPWWRCHSISDCKQHMKVRHFLTVDVTLPWFRDKRLQVSMSGIGDCFKDGDTGLPITQFLSDLRRQHCTAQRYEVFKRQKRSKYPNTPTWCADAAIKAMPWLTSTLASTIPAWIPMIWSSSKRAPLKLRIAWKWTEDRLHTRKTEPYASESGTTPFDCNHRMGYFSK